MLRLENLGKHFDGRWIFQNLNIHIQTKSTGVVIGPSGSGKSVLLKTIAGLMTPDEGSIKIQSSEVGMLFQKNALFDSLSVIDNLLFPLKERKGLTGKAARDLAHQMLEAVGLEHARDQFPDEISGGMQKRLGIARALIVDPPFILLDEPTAGLDPVTSRIIAQLLLDLCKNKGTTSVVVTNDMQRAYQLGNQIYLLANGKLTLGGTPDEVKNSNDPAIRQFIYGLPKGPLFNGEGDFK